MVLRRKNIITKRRALISYCSRSEVPRTLPGDGRGKPRQRIGRGKLPAVTFYCSRCTHRELKTAFFYCSRCTHRELLSVDIATDPVVLASARTVMGTTVTISYCSRELRVAPSRELRTVSFCIDVIVLTAFEQ